MRRTKGPYKRYLQQGSSNNVPARTQRRRLERARNRQQQHQQENVDEMQVPVVNVEIAGNTTSTMGDFSDMSDDATSDVPPPSSSTNSEDDSESSSTTAASGYVNFSEIDSDLEFSESFSSTEDVELNKSKPFEHLISFLKKHAQVSELKINFSVADIIFLVITFSLVHNLTLTAMCDLMKLFNVLCGINLFPANQYFFKKYFNPSFGMQIHYACTVCGHYLGKKNDDDFNAGNKSFVCKCCKKEHFVHGYAYDNTFVTVDVAKQVKDLLEDPTLKFTFNASDNDNTFSDVYDGSMYKRVVLDTDDMPVKYITFTFNSDASPVSKDGKTKINPIYLMINELDYRVRAKHLVLAGVKYGKTIVREDIFLKPFVDQMNALSRGFNVYINGTLTKIKMLGICCCVDSVARAPMQGIKSHRGYFCCSWCHLRGEIVHKNEKMSLKYPIKDHVIAPRTETSFRNCVQALVNDDKDEYTLKGVNSVSPFINLSKFCMVWSFVPDMMHLVMLGITGRFINIWFNDTSFDGYIGSPLKKKYFDKLLNSIKTPVLLKKAPLTLSDLSFWKSKHYENWFLFYSVPLLKGNLPRKYFNHWKSLVEAVSILLQDSVSHDLVIHAENLLMDFVKKTEEYYGKYECTYNMHQLCHLAESVRRFGPLWTHTAYPFESGIGYLKSVLKASKGIPQQIIRSIELGRALIEIYKNCNVNANILKTCESLEEYRKTNCVRSESNECFMGVGKVYNGNMAGLPSDIIFFQYPRIVKNGITFSVVNDNEDVKRDNSYVELSNGGFAQIKFILCSQTEPKLCYIILQNILFEDEPNLTHMKRMLAKGNTFISNLIDIKCVAVHIYVDEFNEYLCKIPLKHYEMNM